MTALSELILSHPAPTYLDARRIPTLPQARKKRLRKEEQMAYALLQETARSAIDDNQLTQRLKRFLSLRAKVIENTSNCYFNNTVSEVNKLAVKIAEAIAPDESPIIKILVPRLDDKQYAILMSS